MHYLWIICPHTELKMYFSIFFTTHLINSKVVTYLRDHFDQVIFNVVRSPNFNPIEGIFGKIKHDFRKNQSFDKN